ncbi:MAG TPA: 2OG-Fe(II) oxygenase [Alphaproteobacteria bacterium]
MSTEQIESERRQIGFFRRAIPPDLCARWIDPAGHTGTEKSLAYEEHSGNRFGVDVARRDARIVKSSYQAEINRWVEALIRRTIAPFHRFHLRDWEQPQLLRYVPGGKHEIHADSEIYENGCWRQVLERDYSLVVFLNTDFTGGGFDLPNQDLHIHPEEPGSALSFPSDHRFSHAVIPVEAGLRYTIVSWIRKLGVMMWLAMSLAEWSIETSEAVLWTVTTVA